MGKQLTVHGDKDKENAFVIHMMLFKDFIRYQVDNRSIVYLEECGDHAILLYITLFLYMPCYVNVFYIKTAH